MYLVISTLSAVFSTLIWYTNKSAREMKISVLCWLFWGSSIMWFVDLIFEYAKEGASVFTPKVSDLLNDSFLGISIVTVALVIWIVIMLVKDPKGVIRSSIKKQSHVER